MRRICAQRTELKAKKDTYCITVTPLHQETLHVVMDSKQCTSVRSVTGLQHFAYIMLVKLISDGSVMIKT